MRKQLFTLIIAYLTAMGGAIAQGTPVRNCATMEYMKEQVKNDPLLKQSREAIEQFTKNYIQQNGGNKYSSVVTIPVVFHIVYNTPSQNISDARIMAQLDVLNKDFSRTNADAGSTPSVFQGVAANTGIQFCLAQRDPSNNPTTGIVRKSTSTTSFGTNDNVKFNSSGGDNAWPAGSYFNIWVCNLSGGVLGYAQFPGGSAATDGVVVLFGSVGGPSAPGTASPYHLGRTLTHEVGHWLNLYHIWGDDGSSCSGSDQVGDTPNQASEHYGCPAFPSVSCSNGPNGDMFMNYMDYTDDACMNMFTQGQSTRSNALFAGGGARNSLLASQGCVPVGGGSCGTAASLSATSITQTSATLSWGAVSGATSYNVQYRVSPSGSWTLTTSATNSKAISGLTAGTAYDFQVQAVCGTTNGNYSSIASFTTTTSGGGCNGDPYGSNNSSANASFINTNADIYATIGSSTDKDWYKFTTTSSAPKVKVTLSNLPYDYDVRLYNANISQIGISQNGGTTSETIIYNASAASTYYIKVYPYSGSSNSLCYLLRANAGATNFKEMSDITSSIEKAGDVSLYPNPASDQLIITLLSDENQPSVITVNDILGRAVITKHTELTDGVNKLSFDLSSLHGGVYYVDAIINGERSIHKFVIEK